ncbi:hypothetical protein ACTA71_000417 [Dictyostelium dimigraforme]
MKRIKSKKNLINEDSRKAHRKVEKRSRNIRNKFIQKINKRLPFVLNSIQKTNSNSNNKEITIERILSQSLSYLQEINEILTEKPNKFTFQNELITDLKNKIKGKEEISLK